MKRTLSILVVAILILSLAACSNTSTAAVASEETDIVSNTLNTSVEQETPQDAESKIEEEEEADSIEYIPNWSDSDLADTLDESATEIIFSGDEITVNGEGAAAANGGVKINAAGSYVFSGTLNDGRIVVSVGDTQLVRLILNGVNVTSTTSAPLFIENAEKTMITLIAGTDNTFTDAATYVFPNEGDTEPNACIFSNDDITINGTGTLTVTGNYNNGIGTDNDLKIVNGNISVTAANNGLKGNDSISIMDGIIDVSATKDGLKVNNDTEIDEGYIYIEGGQINIVAGDDALQSVNSIMIIGGTVAAKSGGKSLNCDGALNIAAGCFQ